MPSKLHQLYRRRSFYSIKENSMHVLERVLGLRQTIHPLIMAGVVPAKL